MSMGGSRGMVTGVATPPNHFKQRIVYPTLVLLRQGIACATNSTNTVAVTRDLRLVYMFALRVRGEVGKVEVKVGMVLKFSHALCAQIIMTQPPPFVNF